MAAPFSTDRRVWAPVLGLGFAFSMAVIVLAQKAPGALDDPNQWVMPNGNYSGWNYSPLDQINLENVKNLSVAWTLPLGIHGLARGVPAGDRRHDVHRHAEAQLRCTRSICKQNGVIKWEFRPEMTLSARDLAIKRACCGAQTRGLAYADGKIFYNTLDGQVFALNAENGKVVWRAENANLAIGETMSAMPLIVNDKVIVGVMGGERGVRGHVTRLQHRHRQPAMALLQHGPQQRSRHRSAVQTVLRRRQGPEPGARLLVRRLLASRRRRDLGLVHLRSRR